MAERLGLDLVEISPNTDPPVCKILDFGKFTNVTFVLHIKCNI